MIRLILHTGRFRDMGYETALSGAEPTAEERDAADHLLASLRRGVPEGGIGIVVKLSHAGRAIEEILAVTSPEPLPAEREARLRAELTRLHGEALPELLKVAGRAVSVSAAREELRRSLDGWLADLLPILPRVPEPPVVTARSRQAWSGVRFAAAAAAVAIGAIVAGTTLHWVGRQTPPMIARDGPDACRPNGAEDAAAFAEAWLALDASIGRELPRDDPFAAVQPDLAMRLQALVPTDAPDILVCQKRRALAAIHRDLADLKAVVQGTGLEQARSLDHYSRGELLNALEAFANLPLPDQAPPCQAQDAVCLPVFLDADAEVLQAIAEAYRILLPNLHPAAGPTLLTSASDLEELERALEASGLRRDEIILRGELHRIGQGDLAAALLDPLHALVDCPRQNTCVALAVRRLWAEP